MNILRSSACAILLCGFVAACSSDSSPVSESDSGTGGSETGGKGTGGASAGGKASTGGTAGTASGGSAGKATGGSAGKATGGTGGETPDAEAPDGEAGGAATDGGDGGVTIPPVPTLGAQIDRFGRPAINTALTHTFDTNDTTKGAAKDAYNAALPATWGTFKTEFEKNLAILDALDGTCGNQLLAATGTANAETYAALATALTDDELYVNSTATTCGVYLGVEAEALKVVAAGGGKCGGRVLTDDVIERSYSVLAAGALTGVDDGVAADEGAQTATFPFEGPPTP
ncbi:MAG TPA: hypothetical protein VH062_30790 [Polyangiaceae bacterium]|jgi:hypothetical protein|nr:hypothetical protein [Polyangiaceae bacterium]